MMLSNLVNRHDVQRAGRKLVRGDAAGLISKFRGSATERVVRQWSDIEPEPTQWWSIPAVRRRWNRMVSGDEHVDFPAYVADRYLAAAGGPTALSLGCGLGGREGRWAELGVLASIDAVDISPAQVEAAQARAKARGDDNVVRFRVADVMAMPTHERYDVVLAEHSLHHLAPMPSVVDRIHSLLRPGGWFLVDEYVGPRRFQWTRRQLAAAQAVLDAIPEEYRVTTAGTVKRRVIRPSVLWMVLTDPSEAIDSARITAQLRSRFDVLEELPYGGAVLHLALADISHHFVGDDPRAAAVLEAAFAEEDRLMAAGTVGSDFCAFVCRRREGDT